MTQLCIEDWTDSQASQWNHAHAVYARPKATGRMACKCRLCGSRWTAKRDDLESSYARHGETCTRYQATLKRWTAGGRDESAARWSLANSYMDRREIIGTFKAGVKCDARCQGAIGHDCECSCGGANHGIGFGL